MNTLEAIAARKSYRGKFLSTPVPQAHLKTIVEAGYHAPSGCNKQTTSFIAVDDPEPCNHEGRRAHCEPCTCRSGE